MCAFIRHLESYHQQRMTTVFSVQTRYLEGTPQCDFRQPVFLSSSRRIRRSVLESTGCRAFPR
jgi:hypothetical protein